MEEQRIITASVLVGTIAANVDNSDISDAQFRQLVRTSLPVTDYHSGRYEPYENSDIGKGPRLKKEVPFF